MSFPSSHANKSEAPPRSVAVVLAGGTGRRVGLNIPKQLIKIAGKTVLEHTLQVFEDAPEIDDVILLMHHRHIAEAESVVAAAGLTKVRGVYAGGTTRNETTQRAIGILRTLTGGGADPKVLFHDAVRPLLSRRIISECVNALDHHQAVDVAIPSADTIVVTRQDSRGTDYIEEIPCRSRLRRGQTPQAFRLSTIENAYEAAAGDPDFNATDDCGVVLRYRPDVPIHVVRGDERNMKVTHPSDIFLAEKLFQLASHASPDPSREDSLRQTLEGKTAVIFGASSGIGASIAELMRDNGVQVFGFSRSTTGTFVENPQHVEEALATAHRTAGRIDYVVNTAGFLRTGKLTDVPSAQITEATAVNYLAPVHIARAAHLYLNASQGHLLLFTSSSYTRGRAEYGLYSSAKAATVNLTQALADEWAVDAIRVNCINPERTRTPMRRNAFGAEPAATLLAPETVAKAAVEVLASMMTGHVIDVRRQNPTVCDK
ncbi:SDR family NAD(P)-dependent oxidoreductase [Streptoverticillium reticulum]|uniref:SDR family NAD(P)-dependent oxidoreductase n=1 Tax=Streptoverticillium reticulum TaxID=1433415 RepID=UPI0039BFA85B